MADSCADLNLTSPVKIQVKPGNNGKVSELRNRSSALIAKSETGGESNGSNFLVENEVKAKNKCDKSNEVSIQINCNQTQDENTRNGAYYIMHCFRLMYWTGMSTFNPDKKDGEETKWAEIIVDVIQKIIFWNVSSLSFVFAFLCLKNNCTIFLINPGVLNSIYVGMWIFSIVAEAYFILMFAFHHKRIKESMATLTKVGTHTIDEVGTEKWKCRNPRKMITVLFVASILVCLMHPLGGPGIAEWSPKRLILNSSKKFSRRLFIWSTDDFAPNSTKIEDLADKYGTRLTPVTISMAITEITMRFWSNMKMDTVLNLAVVISILTWFRNRKFGKKVQYIDFENYSNGYDADELNSPTGDFAEFKLVKKENKVMNGFMEGLVKIAHGYNLLLCAYFVMRCLDSEATAAEFVYLASSLIKVLIVYYFGHKAGAENDKYKQWIRSWAMHSRDPIFLARVPAILDEMRDEPLGLGMGHFIVGHGFILRFLGFVASIFMLEVDDGEDDE